MNLKCGKCWEPDQCNLYIDTLISALTYLEAPNSFSTILCHSKKCDWGRMHLRIQLSDVPPFANVWCIYNDNCHVHTYFPNYSSPSNSIFRTRLIQILLVMEPKPTITIVQFSLLPFVNSSKCYVIYSFKIAKEIHYQFFVKYRIFESDFSMSVWARHLVFSDMYIGSGCSCNLWNVKEKLK